ncbi:MAG TPA: DCC1-like thiol-disulfide oxidoreductase family protein [Terriglobales bacterium]|nr:DCC1-like thiol-disulfide oxidoreductase family protein [Terriglobales bacterium]
MTVTRPNPILLYDGVCGLCNRSVQFVLKHDRNDQFRFAALQSELAAEILGRHGVHAVDLDTVYLVKAYGQPEESLSNRSDAAIAVLRELGGSWGLMADFLGLVPHFLRNWAYNLIAASRYRLFGKYDACPLPDPKDRHKFLDQSPATPSR